MLRGAAISMTIKNISILIGAIFVGVVFYIGQVQYQKKTEITIPVVNTPAQAQYSKIVFAGGCFWCTEAEFSHAPGVISAVSGFTGGDTVNPSYQDVGTGITGHREAVLVYYNEASTTLDALLVAYWKHIDPTDGGGQFADRGHQYTTAIYYTTDIQKQEAEKTKQMIIDTKKFSKPIATEILPYKNFYAAEEYHQHYKDKNPARYEYYRNGSGRNDFIDKNWKNDRTTFIKIMTVSATSAKAITKTMNTNNSTPSSKVLHPWESFTKPSDEQLHTMLTPEQYNVTQKNGTEKPFTNAYAENKAPGIYVDIVSGEPLFLSVDKYDSGTGWPSFVKPVSNKALMLKEDKGIFSNRTEVRSAVANSHLGHVFQDGPQDRGGMRYCMNSASMKFIPLADMEKDGYGEYASQLK